MRTLTVSRSTARFIAQGNPWVQVDRFTKGLNALSCGEAVTLLDEHGKGLASALADPDEFICARMYHQKPHKAFDLDMALQRAFDKRQSLIDDDSTDCFRLVHGEADFLPGLRIEHLAKSLVMTLRASCIACYLDAICKYCQKRFPEHIMIVKEQFDDLQKHPLKIYAYNDKSFDPTIEITGIELGCKMILKPAEDLATGIYVDQRSTREYLRKCCQNKHIANAFAYTGLFSSSLLLAGAASAVDIDISAPALDIAAKNAALNNVADKHQIHTGDSINYFKTCNKHFDIIILDPPTAAHGKGKGTWILRKDYPDLLQSAISCLNKNGLLIACCNTLGSKKQFKLHAHFKEKHPQFQLLSTPSIGKDIPFLKGFLESRPYDLLIGQNPSGFPVS